ncbi:MAG TPA: GNAT family N-acetyltransferase [Chroococcidiopsis sp.]
MNIRWFEPQDARELMQLFYDTVHQINSRDYDLDQVEAWAPQTMDLRAWTDAFQHKFVWVAEVDNQLVGFAELESNGHIDRVYCHKNFQRKGVGRQLLDRLESQARLLEMTHLRVESSITAKPFFERRGYEVLYAETVERRGQSFRRYVMEKRL